MFQMATHLSVPLIDRQAQTVLGTMHAIHRYSINVYQLLLNKEVHSKPYQHLSVYLHV